jgi:hypothetical protein
MNIIKATEPITVAHPVFCIFGQPGICKTSLGYSAAEPLLLDFDNGAHRAANRQDTLQITAWPDVEELMRAGGVLDPYQTITVDTVGRCLDLIAADIAIASPKMAPNGNLSLQGFGALKSRFRNWITQLRALGKDVLLVAHDREDKDGDTRVVRPDIIGASYGEVMKVADFVGYLYMAGKDRVLDFNPTDRWIGKNPAGWQPFKVPPVAKASAFMAQRFTEGRAALGAISEASAKITSQVEQWREAIDGYSEPDEMTRAIPEINTLPPVAAPAVKQLLLERATALGFQFDKASKRFVALNRAEAPTAEELGV